MTLQVKEDPSQTLLYHLKIIFPVLWEQTVLINDNDCVRCGHLYASLPIGKLLSGTARA